MLSWIDIIRFATEGNPEPTQHIEKTEDEWRELLTPEQFRITRQKGTERSYTGELCNIYTPGIYICVCCKTELFNSEVKFDSGTGWPSFTQSIQENTVKYEIDQSFDMVRIEVICNVCDSHLGHVFRDGPKPNRLRYCINSTAIQLK